METSTTIAGFPIDNSVVEYMKDTKNQYRESGEPHI
jgi:hypothetical protein